MKIEIIFGKSVYDYIANTWLDVKKIEVEIPDNLKDYKVIGAIYAEEVQDVN